jgi:hypothetical protein
LTGFKNDSFSRSKLWNLALMWGIGNLFGFFLVYVFPFRFPYVSSIHHIIIKIIITISINKLDYIIGKSVQFVFYPIDVPILITLLFTILLYHPFLPKLANKTIFFFILMHIFGELYVLAPTLVHICV